MTTQLLLIAGERRAIDGQPFDRSARNTGLLPGDRVEWSSSDTDVAIVVSPDPTQPLAALLIAQSVGVAQIKVSIFGASGKTSYGVTSVTVVPGEAIGVDILAGPPVESD